MYRSSDRSPRPPTKIEYQARWVRPGFLVIALLLPVLGLVMLGGLHATRLSCVRNGPANGMCHIQRYALIGAFEIDVPLEDVSEIDTKIITGSKGSKRAELRLRSTGRPGMNAIDLETGPWGHVDPDKAYELQSRFFSFKQGATGSFDEWLTLGPATSKGATIFALILLAFAFAMLREQLGQLSSVRIVVDHDREVIVVRREEIPFGEIEDVTVEHGRAHFWSSHKHEHVPGFRVVIMRRNGKPVPATTTFRPGDSTPHELAREQLLRALRRPLD